MTWPVFLAAAMAFLTGCASAGEPGSSPFLLGVNLAGAEFGDRVPGLRGTDYVYPSAQEIDYYIDRGANVFRIPFKWERLQPVLRGPLVSDEAAELDKLIAHASDRDAIVILDPHNFGRRIVEGSQFVIGESDAVASADFAHFWSLLAQRYHSSANVVFGLMNEPHDQDGETLVSVLNEAIRAIRSAGARNLVLAPGNAWTGAHSWLTSGNGELMLQLVDPADNLAFDVHQYLDADSGGAGLECVAGAATSRLRPFLEWARANKRRGFLGEFGVAANPLCLTELGDLMGELERDRDVWLGGAYWAGGPWWGDYPLSIEPANIATPVDRPQMQVLRTYFEKN